MISNHQDIINYIFIFQCFFWSKWSTLKSNISKILIVPTHSAQILKEQERVNISEWVSWSGFRALSRVGAFSGSKQGAKVGKFRKVKMAFRHWRIFFLWFYQFFLYNDRKVLDMLCYHTKFQGHFWAKIFWHPPNPRAIKKKKLKFSPSFFFLLTVDLK